MIKYGQKWSKIPILTEKFNNDRKRSNMVKNGRKWSKMVENGQKWSKMVKLDKKFKTD